MGASSETMQVSPAGADQGQGATSGFVTSTGEFTPDWTTRFGDEYAAYRGDPTLSRYKSLPELGRAFVEQRRALGSRADAVVVPQDPGAEATPEQRSAYERTLARYRETLGIPDSPDNYDIAPKEMPEGFEWRPEMAKPFLEIAHKHNIPPAAMRELIQADIQREVEHVNMIRQESERILAEGKQALKDSWGGNYDAKIRTAQRAVDMVASKLGLEDLPKAEDFRNPSVVRAFAYVGELLSEDKVNKGGNAGPSSTLTGSALMSAMQRGEVPEYAHLSKRYREGDSTAAAEMRRIAGLR